jgi:hypothetical protein
MRAGVAGALSGARWDRGKIEALDGYARVLRTFTVDGVSAVRTDVLAALSAEWQAWDQPLRTLAKALGISPQQLTNLRRAAGRHSKQKR